MKTIEERVQILEGTVQSLLDAFLTSQSNQVNTQGQIDDTSNKVENITPTTYTKTAYIGDTEVVFADVPFGNLTVFVNNSDGYYPDYKVSRSNDRITIVFDAPLMYATNITISIL